MFGALVGRQDLCSEVTSQQELGKATSGSGRMDNRGVVSGVLGRRRRRGLCFEKGKLSDWEEVVQCTRARLV